MSRPDLPMLSSCTALLRRVPFTCAFLAVMLAANGLAGTFSGHIDQSVLAARGIGVEALRDGDLSRFVSAIVLSHDLPMLLRQLPFAALVIGRAEWLWGTWRAAGLFFAVDVMATLVLLAAVAQVPALATLAETTDVGMSLGGFGVIGVLIATWRHRVPAVIAILALVAVKYALAPEPLADAGHVIALTLGFCLGLGRAYIPGLEKAADIAHQDPSHRWAGRQAAERRARRPAAPCQQDGQQ
ncbi:hypothetical protein GGQ68_002219 [Sagittula marina]|uniref:Rhomboid family protein n=1 Tax=Sagittula marina TaxID=943940 RepID=A0A7W6DMJ6_9RHOB|nr:rhomboid-like protein [Sagittula marina]MBB3985881.1 hypothetical protein [Sagittula marina]